MAITFLDPFRPVQITTFGKGLSLANPSIETAANPLTTVFIGAVQARLSGTLNRPNIGTVGKPTMRVRGRVKLQGRGNSLGGFLEVDEEIYFVNSNGTFQVEIPPGSDIYIRAPGYLSALIPNVNARSTDPVKIPTLTLLFGDVDDDGRIDILDLSTAAGNFGSTFRELPSP